MKTIGKLLEASEFDVAVDESFEAPEFGGIIDGASDASGVGAKILVNNSVASILPT